VVTINTTKFNNKIAHCAQELYLFIPCGSYKTVSHFPTQHLPTGLCNGNTLWSLRTYTYV